MLSVSYTAWLVSGCFEINYLQGEYVSKQVNPPVSAGVKIDQ